MVQFGLGSGIKPKGIFRHFDHPIRKIAAASAIPEMIEQQIQKLVLYRAGRLQLFVRQAGPWLEMSVRDDGQGVSLKAWDSAG
jgi:hypothetical protein